jgi:hypothetical protein
VASEEVSDPAASYGGTVGRLAGIAEVYGGEHWRCASIEEKLLKR